MLRYFAAIAVSCLSCLTAAQAQVLSGERQISLLGNDGESIVIGTIRFEPVGERATYEIRWSEAAFADHFLSMRPFRCVEGPQKHWCHVDYPYAIRREVSATDLTDLEYDLLFLHKGSAEYGINMWNGVYYRLSHAEDRLTGEMQDIDMDVLSAPPDAENLRPITDKHLHPAEPEGHWLPRLVIE